MRIKFINISLVIILVLILTMSWQKQQPIYDIDTKINEASTVLEECYGCEVGSYVCGKCLVGCLSRYVNKFIKKKQSIKIVFLVVPVITSVAAVAIVVRIKSPE